MDEETADGYSTPSFYGRQIAARDAEQLPEPDDGCSAPPSEVAEDAADAHVTRVGVAVGPAHTPSPPHRHDSTTRRGVLVGALFVAAATGAGVAVGRAAHTSAPAPSVADIPADLAAAVSAERVLLADVEAALAGSHGTTRSILRMIRADHAAHLNALQNALAIAVYPAQPSATRSAAPSASAAGSGSTAGSDAPRIAPATVLSRAQLRAAERRASVRAAQRALVANGSSAVLLASIAACEATHVELLS